MTSCNLQLELDQPQKKFLPGETVAGTLTVDVTDDCTCNALTVKRLWKTHGKGTQNEGGEQLQVFAEDERWSSGEVFEYEFSFDVPPGPYTYRGDLINVDWYIRAEADIAWGLDSDVEQDFLVVPASADEFVVGTKDVPVTEPTAQLEWGKIGFGAFFAMIGSVPMWFALSSVLEGGSVGGAAMALLFGGIFLAVGGYVVYTGVRNYLAEKKLGTVDVSISDSVATPGQTLTYNVEMSPRDDVEVNEISMILRGKEWVKYRHGTDTKTQENKIFGDERIAAQNKAYTAGSQLAISEDLDLPDSAPFSFEAERNRIRWIAEFHVDVADWPDWKDQLYLTVRPDPDREPDRTGAGSQTQLERDETASAEKASPEKAESGEPVTARGEPSLAPEPADEGPEREPDRESPETREQPVGVGDEISGEATQTAADTSEQPATVEQGGTDDSSVRDGEFTGADKESSLDLEDDDWSDIGTDSNLDWDDETESSKDEPDKQKNKPDDWETDWDDW